MSPILPANLMDSLRRLRLCCFPSSSRRARWSLAMSSRVPALLTLFLLVTGTQAQPRTDSLGDPLPDGAIARIGTLRFKHNPAQGSTVDVALFAPDGSKIVSLSQNNDSIRLWDAGSAKEIPG